MRTSVRPDGRGRHPSSLAQIQPPPRPAEPANARALKHGAYSRRLKAPRVEEVLAELVEEHPHEAVANLRALAELYVQAERLSEWVAGREDGGVTPNGTIAPPVLEARKGWALYLDKARELGVTSRGRRELAGLPEDRPRPRSRLARHLEGGEDTDEAA
jgi:hypothetical protein